MVTSVDVALLGCLLLHLFELNQSSSVAIKIAQDVSANSINSTNKPTSTDPDDKAFVPQVTIWSEQGQQKPVTVEQRYEPNWKSIDSRPLPEWYDEAKVGIFLHWGVYSVPGFGSEWFWWNWKGKSYEAYVKFMQRNYEPEFTYADFGPQFTAEFFNPEEWAGIFELSGAKYVVLTSKHHEGFTLWPSKFSFQWNAADVGPKRDLVGDLAKAIRAKTDLRFGLYYSLYEWFHPLYLQDKANNFTTRDFAELKSIPCLKEIVNNYKPEIIWSDGDWEPKPEYWKSQEFLAWLYNDSPVRETVVANDRWGSQMPCKHGGFYTCTDRFNPGTLQPHKWENCMTLDRQSWGYRRNAKAVDYLSIDELIQTLAETVSCGGNILINAGPTSDGMIPPIMEQRLRDLGRWLRINGEGIYKSKPWSHQNDTLTSGVWYTKRPDLAGSPVYAIVLDWPEGDLLKLKLPVPSSETNISLLGNENEPLKWKVYDSILNIEFPNRAEVKSDWAWILKLTSIKN